MVDAIVKILSFNFHYDYFEYVWDEETYDLDDDSAFHEFLTTHEMAQNEQKRKVCSALKNLLLTAGALAKSVNSDVYQQWRELFVRYTYDYKAFNNGCAVETAKQFVDDIQSAAKLTFADLAIADHLRTLS